MISQCNHVRPGAGAEEHRALLRVIMTYYHDHVKISAIDASLADSLFSPHRAGPMLNQTAEYALRTAVYLAEQGERGPVVASEMAVALSIPSNYLSKILHQLARDGVLTSQRGKSGGFRLARAPEQITLTQVIAAFDPIDEKRRCLLGRTVCSDRTPCPAHERWREHAAGYAKFFHETTLAMVVPLSAAVKPRRRRKA